MTVDDFSELADSIAKEIANGQTVNEEGVFLKRAQEMAIPLDNSEIQLLKTMKYTSK